MNLRVLVLLLLGIAAAVQCQQTTVASSKPTFAKAVINGYRVIKDLFYILFGNVTSFRKFLAAASDLATELFPLSPLPVVPEPWWGEQQSSQDTSIRPYKVNFTDAMISDLRARITDRRNITPALSGAVHTYGTNAEYLASLIDDWANNYDFKAREDWLNSFPQYVTNIQGLDIHFIHVKPANPGSKKVLPLLLQHGFPDTVFQFVHVFQYLTAQRNDTDFVFEIIVAHLPGYGFSEATNKKGMAAYQMGIIMKNLMLRLNKPQFYIHAGDLGHFVADSMSVLFPDNVLGYHSNFPFSSRPQTLVKWVLGQLYPQAVVEAQFEDRLYPLTDRLKFYLEQFGYFHLQTTKPDNVGHGLDDSPVALASWLIQNWIMATDVAGELVIDANLPKNYDMRDWLDSLTVFWSSKCMTTCVRLYAEILAIYQNPLSFEILTNPTPVPFAAINFRHELIYMPDEFLRDKYPNLVQTVTLDYGGHFAGYQNPAVLADSICTAVKKMEQFHQNSTAKP